MRLEEFAGGPPVVVTIGGASVPTDAIGAITITHGRPSADVRPEASTATLVVKVAALAAWPVLGTPVTVDLSPGMLAALGAAAGAARRFTGRVTNPTVRPGAGLATITAAGPRSRAARIPIGDTPWPAELDGPRAARVLAEVLAADPSFTVGAIDPGTVTVLARDVDRQPAGALLDALAADTGGDAWQLRSGALVWHDARHRQNAAPILTLAAGDVLAGAEWAQDLDGMLTDLTVGYGAPVLDPITGDTSQAEVRVTDAGAEDPITGPGFGRLSARVATQLADAGAAYAYASEQVGRRSWPRWRVPALAVDLLRTLDPAQAAALAGAEAGALLEVVGLPTTGPLSSTRLWLEGWAEEITRTHWRMALAVTAYGQTGPAPRWLDVPTDYVPAAAPGESQPAREPLTWGSAPVAGVTWLAAVAWWPGEDVDLGRWADYPSNIRWADVPALTEWGDLP